MDTVPRWKQGSLTYMHVIAILIGYNQQSPESMSILDLHGLR